MVSNLVFFDVETDSKNPHTAKLLEVGVAVYSIGGRMVKSFSTFVQQDEWSRDVCELIGACDADVANGVSMLEVHDLLSPYFLSSKYIIGHNILNYDRRVMESNGLGDLFRGKCIVDTMVDLPFPERTTSKRLTHLCADHNIFTPNAHGALYDCMYTADLFFKYNIAETLERANGPLVWVKAGVNFDTKDLAKKHGFRFDGKQKIWVKKVRLFDRDRFLAKINGAFTLSRQPDEYEPPED